MEKSLNKVKYKLTLIIIKYIPFLIAVGNVLNSFLSYYNYDCRWLNYTIGLSIVPTIFIYLVSDILKFCNYHKVFLHYAVLITIINWIDSYIGIPVSDTIYYLIGITLFCIASFIALYLHLRCLKHKKSIINN